MKAPGTHETIISLWTGCHSKLSKIRLVLLAVRVEETGELSSAMREDRPRFRGCPTTGQRSCESFLQRGFDISVEFRSSRRRCSVPVESGLLPSSDFSLNFQISEVLRKMPLRRALSSADPTFHDSQLRRLHHVTFLITRSPVHSCSADTDLRRSDRIHGLGRRISASFLWLCGQSLSIPAAAIRVEPGTTTETG